ncbi:MAG: anti-sigma regulatory factor [Desulfobacterales bacterium]|nr:anti-sigma regulatory factor [Desulfobacterales bacterium]
MELFSDNLEFEVSEPADNAQVVFSTRRLLADMGFDETRQYLIASAVSELSTNIIRYAGRGTVTLTCLENAGTVGVEVIALDQGPGIEDLDRAMTENVSTGNGLGLGLPSVKRIMDEFDIRSAPGEGTRIRAVKWMK